ncbi:hypothetical protein ACWD1Z_14210 [Streptomyces sp. NPDC002784]
MSAFTDLSGEKYGLTPLIVFGGLGGLMLPLVLTMIPAALFG